MSIKPLAYDVMMMNRQKAKKRDFATLFLAKSEIPSPVHTEKTVIGLVQAYATPQFPTAWFISLIYSD